MENDEFLDDYLNEDVIEEEDSTFEDPILNSEEESEQYNQPQEEVDILSTLLQDKGISDPSRIQIENENGEKELVDFRDLPVEEQLEILRQDDDELDDDEVNVINYLRANNLKFEDVINYAKSQGINEYLANQPSNVEIDSLTDDEVFLTDLLTRIPDITDEEAQIALETEKQNPDLYNKKVQALRDDLNEKEAIRLQEENQAFG
jgi:hypothetical protein